MFMLSLCAKLYLPSINCSLFIRTKLKAKENFRTTPKLLFRIVQNMLL